MVFCCRSDEGVLFYSIRAGAGPASPLQGSRLEDDGTPVQPTNDQLLGQIDSVEAGEMTGWACMKGYMGKPLQVQCHLCKGGWYSPAIRMSTKECMDCCPGFLWCWICDIESACVCV